MTIKAKRITVLIFCILLTLVCILPFIIMFLNATKTANELSVGRVDRLPELTNAFIASFIPGENLSANWGHLLAADALAVSMSRAFINSLIVAVGSTALSVYVSTLTAYGFTVYNFKGNKSLYAFILAVLMVPTQVSIVAFYSLMQSFDWASGWRSLLPLIIPAMAAPSTVFFMRQYMKGALSLEMVESGRIDGSSEFGIFNRLALPILIPGMATMAIFAMVASWNNLFLPMVLLRGEWRTVPVYVSLLSGGRHQIQTGAIFLGLSLTTIPLMTFYFLLSKQIIAGVTLGGVKE
jgi:multiple sugar transport system permease protein